MYDLSWFLMILFVVYIFCTIVYEFVCWFYVFFQKKDLWMIIFDLIWLCMIFCLFWIILYMCCMCVSCMCRFCLCVVLFVAILYYFVYCLRLCMILYYCMILYGWVWFSYDFAWTVFLFCMILYEYAWL